MPRRMTQHSQADADAMSYMLCSILVNLLVGYVLLGAAFSEAVFQGLVPQEALFQEVVSQEGIFIEHFQCLCRARASIANRASLAATEAAQRASAYSSAASSAAARAAALAER